MHNGLAPKEKGKSKALGGIGELCSYRRSYGVHQLSEEGLQFKITTKHEIRMATSACHFAFCQDVEWTYAYTFAKRAARIRRRPVSSYCKLKSIVLTGFLLQAKAQVQQFCARHSAGSEHGASTDHCDRRRAIDENARRSISASISFHRCCTLAPAKCLCNSSSQDLHE